LMAVLGVRYRLDLATNGAEALALARERSPDLILLDVLLPDRDGYSVCEALKADPATCDIPVIFITAKRDLEDETRGFRAGAADYVTKPVNPPILLARARAQLALAAQLKAARRERHASDVQAVEAREARDRSEAERQRLTERQQALLEIARVALRDLALDEYLAAIFEALGRLSWLAIEPRAGLFLVNRKNELVLAAEYHLYEERRCHRVPAGHCVCGQALATRQPLFVPSLAEHNPRHAHGAPDTGCHALPLVEGERVYGVLTVLAPPDSAEPAVSAALLTEVAQTLTSLIRRRLAEETSRASQVEIQMARNEIIAKLSVAADFRDSETGLHGVRMARYAGAIARALGCDPAFCELLELAAPLHDVGKIGIRDDILKAARRLTPEEFAVMRTHTTIGGRILDGDDPLIALAREIALTHHERWDGTGYPRALAGTAIPLAGQVCAIADVFDALTTARPYKTPWSVEQALDALQRERDAAFAPAVVAAFHDGLAEILAIQQRYRDDVIGLRETLAIPRAAPPAADAWLPWRDDYSVGIPALDEHHRYLIDWINRVHRALHARDGVAEIARALFGLEQYTRIHFRAEERLMAAHEHVGVEAHCRQHREFEAELRALRAELTYNPLIVGDGMLTYLRDWLFRHILHSDKHILAQCRAPTGEHARDRAPPEIDRSAPRGC